MISLTSPLIFGGCHVSIGTPFNTLQVKVGSQALFSWASIAAQAPAVLHLQDDRPTERTFRRFRLQPWSPEFMAEPRDSG